MRWQITYRPKKSPYVRGLERRTHTKLKRNESTITLSGTDLNTRKEALRTIKKMYPWAIIVSLKKAKS